MAGTLTLSTLSDGTNSTSATNAIQGSAKAWVNFDGTSGTRRASYNVSSVTRNASGDYTINFTNAFSDTNYSATSMARWGAGNGTQMRVIGIYPSSTVASVMTTTSLRVNSAYVNGAIDDSDVVCVSVFR